MRRALPRSLDPLPDESLPGYLLRLAHRAGQPVAQVAMATALVDGPKMRLPAARMFALEPDLAAWFASATRLTPGEVAALTLSTLGRTYPALDPRPRGRTLDLRGVFSQQPWVFARSSRYCPDCLRGDASAVQNAHGGAWRRSWRLPVVFACTAHARFLDHTCPGCGLPALHRAGPGQALIPAQSAPPSHPAACRNRLPGAGPHQPGPLCGYRLDQAAPTPPTPVAPDRLALQQRLLRLLDPHHDYLSPATGPEAAAPTDGTDPRRAFTDLRVVTCLINASWPAARELVAPGDAVLIEAHARSLRAHLGQRRDRGRVTRDVGVYERQPLHAATGAALIAAATALTAGDLPVVRDRLRACLDATDRPGSFAKWVKQFLVEDDLCSPGLRQALGLETRARHIIAEAAGTTGGCLTAPRTVSFTAAHIPQRPRQRWIEAFFSDFTDLHPTLLRRTVSLRLAQDATGGPIAVAAQALGLSHDIAAHALFIVHRQLATPDRHARFTAALQTLRHHVEDVETLTDYGRRRHVARDFTVDADLWTVLTWGLDLPERTRTARYYRHDLEHVAATTWIWARVTHSETRYAPTLGHLPGRHGPSTLERRYVTDHLRLTRDGSGDYRRGLRRHLDDFADALAARIDSGHRLHKAVALARTSLRPPR